MAPLVGDEKALRRVSGRQDQNDTQKILRRVSKRYSGGYLNDAQKSNREAESQRSSNSDPPELKAAEKRIRGVGAARAGAGVS